MLGILKIYSYSSVFLMCVFFWLVGTKDRELINVVIDELD